MQEYFEMVVAFGQTPIYTAWLHATIELILTTYVMGAFNVVIRIPWKHGLKREILIMAALTIGNAALPMIHPTMALMLSSFIMIVGISIWYFGVILDIYDDSEFSTKVMLFMANPIAVVATLLIRRLRNQRSKQDGDQPISV